MGTRMHAGLEHALDFAAEHLDERGLLALDRARRVVSGAAEFRVGGRSRIGDVEVTYADLLWAALLSLATAAEFAKEAQRLRWVDGPRGLDRNTDPCVRFGPDVVAWIATCLSADGDLRPVPACATTCLLQTGTREAWELAGRVRSICGEAPPANVLRDEWIRRHPSVAAACACVDATGGEAASWAAETSLRLADLGGARRSPDEDSRSVDSASVLRELDRGYARLSTDGAEGWPFFGVFSHSMCHHALRLVAAVRPGTRDWCVVLTQVTGDCADLTEFREFSYGTGGACGDDVDRAKTPEMEPADEDTECDPDATVEVAGAAGRCRVTPEDVADPTLAPEGEDPVEFLSTSRLRVWLRAVRDRLWETPETIVRRCLGDGPFTIVAATDRFHHDDELPPSEQPAYRTLAEAIEHADPSRFLPGEPNVWFDDPERRRPDA